MLLLTNLLDLRRISPSAEPDSEHVSKSFLQLRYVISLLGPGLW